MVAEEKRESIFDIFRQRALQLVALLRKMTCNHIFDDHIFDMVNTTRSSAQIAHFAMLYIYMYTHINMCMHV